MFDKPNKIYTREEEYEIFEIIRAGQAAEKKISAITAQKKKIKPEELTELQSLAEKGKEAREQFIIDNRFLCYSFVRKNRKEVSPDSQDFEDLISEAYRGLNKAIDVFDHKRGLKFSTCAFQWIRSYTNHYFQRTDHFLITQEPTYLAYKRVTRFIRDYQEMHDGRSPEKEEILKNVKITPHLLNSLMFMPQKTVELDAELPRKKPNSDMTNKYDLIADKEKSVVAAVEEKGIVDGVHQAIEKSLSNKEKTIVSMVWGLYGYEATKFPDIGKRLGMTGKNAQHYYYKAIEKLRPALAERGFSPSSLMG